MIYAEGWRRLRRRKLFDAWQRSAPPCVVSWTQRHHRRRCYGAAGRLLERLTDRLTAQQIAAGLAVFGLVVFVAGVINKHCACAGLPNLGETLNDVISDFYANVSVDCLSVAFGIFVINRLNERRAEQELKAQLIREMGHPSDIGITHQAVRDLRAQGWLMDGSLKKASLISANLERADLRNSNLQDASLVGCNLKEARLVKANLQSADLTMADLREADLLGADLYRARRLTNQQLTKVATLYGAIMPDGSRYDGRFKLKNDLAPATQSWPSINLEDDKEMADYYNVSLEEYLAGQEWARENLADLRREAGLDPDTGLPVEPANGTEPQLEHRRNGHRHKASMVAHRTRR